MTRSLLCTYTIPIMRTIAQFLNCLDIAYAKSNASLRITRLWKIKPLSWEIFLIGQRHWRVLRKRLNATVKSMFLREREIVDELLDISQGSGFDEMMGDLASAFVHSAGMDPLDRLCHLQVQALAARQGEAREQGLSHELVGKSEECLGSLGTRDDQPHALRLLDGRH